jgi:hypothetical protein
MNHQSIRLCQSLLDNLKHDLPTERNLQLRMEIAQEIWLSCIEELGEHLNKKAEVTLLSCAEQSRQPKKHQEPAPSAVKRLRPSSSLGQVVQASL